MICVTCDNHINEDDIDVGVFSFKCPNCLTDYVGSIDIYDAPFEDETRREEHIKHFNTLMKDNGVPEDDDIWRDEEWNNYLDMLLSNNDISQYECDEWELE